MTPQIQPSLRAVALVAFAHFATGAAFAEKDNDHRGHGKDKKEQKYKPGKQSKRERTKSAWSVTTCVWAPISMTTIAARHAPTTSSSTRRARAAHRA